MKRKKQWIRHPIELSIFMKQFDNIVYVWCNMPTNKTVVIIIILIISYKCDRAMFK